MAINKSELSKQFTEQQRREIDALEAKIDTELKTNYSGDRVIVQIQGDIHARVQKEIERRYRQAGWKIKFESDQRDGDWIELN